jgi:hypothetical protein
VTGALRELAEGLARKTTRRGFFGRGADVAFGALAGAAAGTLSKAGGVSAGLGTVCVFPGPPCECDNCQTSGVCAKPCIILTTFWASGCWVEQGVTCCDCDCLGLNGIVECGCGSDYHNDPANCATP